MEPSTNRPTVRALVSAEAQSVREHAAQRGRDAGPITIGIHVVGHLLGAMLVLVMWNTVKALKAWTHWRRSSSGTHRNAARVARAAERVTETIPSSDVAQDAMTEERVALERSAPDSQPTERTEDGR